MIKKHATVRKDIPATQNVTGFGPNKNLSVKLLDYSKYDLNKRVYVYVNGQLLISGRKNDFWAGDNETTGMRMECQSHTLAFRDDSLLAEEYLSSALTIDFFSSGELGQVSSEVSSLQKNEGWLYKSQLAKKNIYGSVIVIRESAQRPPCSLYPTFQETSPEGFSQGTINSINREFDQIIDEIKQLLGKGDILQARSLIKGERTSSSIWPKSLHRWALLLAEPEVSKQPREARQNSDYNFRWLKANKHKYLGQWIAIKNGMLIDSDSDRVVLHRRLKAQNQLAGLLFIHVEH